MSIASYTRSTVWRAFQNIVRSGPSPLVATAIAWLTLSFVAGCGSDRVIVEPISPPSTTPTAPLQPPSSPAPGLRSDPESSRAIAGTGGGAARGSHEIVRREEADGGAAASSEAVESWQFGADPGRLHVSENFRIHSTLSDGSLDRALTTFSERALAQYRSAIVALPAPPAPLETFIFGNRAQWERFTRDRLGRSAGPYLSMGKGGFTTEGDAILYDIGRLDTLTILAHEGWHQYTQRTFRHPLPLWLEEGVACWMEAVRPGRGDSSKSPFLPWRNYERFGELRNGARADMFIPLEALLDSTPEQFLRQGKDRLLLYYAQVWALVHFLNEGEGGRYADALRQLLSDAAEGRLAGRMANSQAFPNPRARTMHLQSRVGKWVVLEYFNPRFAEFKDEYERFLRQITAPGVSQAVWRGESPVSPVAKP